MPHIDGFIHRLAAHARYSVQPSHDPQRIHCLLPTSSQQPAIPFSGCSDYTPNFCLCAIIAQQRSIPQRQNDYSRKNTDNAPSTRPFKTKLQPAHDHVHCVYHKEPPGTTHSALFRMCSDTAHIIYSPLTLNTFPDFSNSASNEVLIWPFEQPGLLAAKSSITPTLLSVGMERTRSFSFCCSSSGSGCCDFLVPVGAAAEAAEFRAWKASDGAGGGAIALARTLSWAELEEVGAEVGAADGSFPAATFVLGVSQ